MHPKWHLYLLLSWAIDAALFLVVVLAAPLWLAFHYARVLRECLIVISKYNDQEIKAAIRLAKYQQTQHPFDAGLEPVGKDGLKSE